VVPFLPPAANRKPFSLLAHNKTQAAKKNKHHHEGFEKLSTNTDAKLMAREAMAASRRGKF
jgi:hypothetical protein